MKEYTELVIIIDKSGSMSGLEDSVIKGYNALMKEQKEEGATKVTTIFFNSEIEFVHSEEDIETLKPLTEKDYAPYGRTALLDTVGTAIAKIEAKYKRVKKGQLPTHTIFSIMTDGLENASREYSYHDVRQMIEEKRRKGWEFIFQAANIDAAREGVRFGIHRRSCYCYSASKMGVLNEMEESSKRILELRRKPSK